MSLPSASAAAASAALSPALTELRVRVHELVEELVAIAQEDFGIAAAAADDPHAVLAQLSALYDPLLPVGQQRLHRIIHELALTLVDCSALVPGYEFDAADGDVMTFAVRLFPAPVMRMVRVFMEDFQHTAGKREFREHFRIVLDQIQRMRDGAAYTASNMARFLSRRQRIGPQLQRHMGSFINTDFSSARPRASREETRLAVARADSLLDGVLADKPPQTQEEVVRMQAQLLELSRSLKRIRDGLGEGESNKKPKPQ